MNERTKTCDCPRRHARRGVVDRLVQPEAATETLGGKPLQVFARRRRRHHQRHRAGIRRDDQVLRQATLEAKPRHAERAILVIEPRIDRVVAGLGHPPRHAATCAIVDLRAHYLLRGAVEQGIGIARHHQLRHQVLEHRAAPRQQCRGAFDLGHHPPQREPALLRQLALGDRHEVAQPRLGGEQVVLAGVQAPFVDVVADRQQVAGAVIEEAIFHLRQLAGQVRQPFHLQDAVAGAYLQRDVILLATQLPQRGDRRDLGGGHCRSRQPALQFCLCGDAVVQQRKRAALGLAAACGQRGNRLGTVAEAGQAPDR